jgi:hypothetical protein
MLEQPRQEVLLLGQCDQTVAHVARRRHSQALPEPTGASAVVAHRHHGGQRRPVVAIDHPAQTAQHGGQTGAATECNDASRTNVTIGPRRFRGRAHRLVRASS